jgi:hypothetical protein
MICQIHPAYARRRSELRAMDLDALAPIICGAGPLPLRALALWSAFGGADRSGPNYRSRRETSAIFDRLLAAGSPRRVVEIARWNYRRTGELLAPLLALMAREPPQGARAAIEDCPPEVMIGDTPGWAYDQFCREGRAVFARFLETEAASAQWLRQSVAASRRAALLGHLVFRVEGGLVDRRLRWDVGDRLRREGDFECSGPDCPETGEILGRVRADVPRLNEIRAELLAGP